MRACGHCGGGPGCLLQVPGCVIFMRLCLTWVHRGLKLGLKHGRSCISIVLCKLCLQRDMQKKFGLHMDKFRPDKLRLGLALLLWSSSSSVHAEDVQQVGEVETPWPDSRQLLAGQQLAPHSARVGDGAALGQDDEDKALGMASRSATTLKSSAAQWGRKPRHLSGTMKTTAAAAMCFEYFPAPAEPMWAVLGLAIVQPMSI